MMSFMIVMAISITKVRQLGAWLTDPGCSFMRLELPNMKVPLQIISSMVEVVCIVILVIYCIAGIFQMV